MIRQATCRTCGKPFTFVVRRVRPRVYCSPACYPSNVWTLGRRRQRAEPAR